MKNRIICHIKHFMLFSLICFLSFQLLAQEIGKPRQVHSVRNVGRQKDGKYSLSFARYTGAEARYLQTGRKDRPTGNLPSAVGKKKKLNGSENPLQIRRIRFHFDMNNWNTMGLVGTDTIFMDMGNMTWINSTTLEAYMPDGYYEMVTAMDDVSNNPIYLFKHRFHVYRDMDTNLLSTSASHKVTLNAVNESGDTLIGNPLASGDGWGINVEFEDGLATSFYSCCYTGSLPDDLHMNDTPPEMKILTNRIFVTGTSHYHHYMVTYPPIKGLTGDLSMTNQPQDLHKISAVFSSTPGGRDYYFAWGYGPVQNDSITGSVNSFVGAFLLNDYPASATDTVDYYFNQSACDTNKSFFASFADHLEMNPMQSPASSDMMCPITYLYRDSLFIFSCQGNYPPVDCDYRLSQGGYIPFSTSAPFNVSWQYNQPLLPEIRIMSHFRGESNERRYIDQSFSTYEIWDNTGRLFRDTLRNFNITYNFPNPLKCRVVLSDSNYRMFGRQGFLQTLLDFDLANPVDASSPVLLAFKVLQGNEISQTLVRGYPASVKFTAADYNFSATYQLTINTPALARLFIKPTSDTSWTEQNVNAVPSLADSTTGMTYISDLSTALYLFPDSTIADLKIILVDSAGNTTTQVMHPAFMLRDALVDVPGEPGVRHYSVYPNPAHDRIFIKGIGLSADVIVYNILGQPVLKSVNKPVIDLSELGCGVYFLSIIDSQTGKKENFKIIRQ